MPNRILREFWLTSESIDALTAEGERFFARLRLVTDYRGRFEALDVRGGLPFRPRLRGKAVSHESR
jgi:hypothetical protein